MKKIIRYQKLVKMEPRDGVAYSTVYVKQTLEQRRELMRHIRKCTEELIAAIEQDNGWREVISKPIKGFKRTKGQNRNTVEIIEDMINEGRQRKRDGMPKDFALAPIERWNKLFKDTEYEIELVQTFNTFNNFLDLIDENQTKL